MWVRALKQLGWVVCICVPIAMIHANQNYLLESEVIGHCQRRIGHCPAFMHSHAYVVTEAAGRTGRVDLISKSVFRNEAIGPITDELDAVERRDAGDRKSTRLNSSH